MFRAGSTTKPDPSPGPGHVFVDIPHHPESWRSYEVETATWSNGDGERHHHPRHRGRGRAATCDPDALRHDQRESAGSKGDVRGAEPRPDPDLLGALQSDPVGLHAAGFV